MAGSSRTLFARLRSRRLAVGLIACSIAYAVVGTLVPQVSGGSSRAVDQWQLAHPWLAPVTRALGLHSAFSSPIFLTLAALLAIATTLCAWERTRSALALLRRAGSVSEAEVRRLQEHPGLRIPASAPAETALPAAERELRRLRLRVRRGPKVLEASSGRLGLVGSPVFHWTLALLFLTIGVGRLTRAEGTIALPLGYAKQDVADSYEHQAAGPLYLGHSGLTLVATDLRPYKDPSGQDRGISPVIALSRGGVLLARQRVYPNNPLRDGALMIHATDYGLAPVVSAESSGTVLKAEELVDFDESRPSGTSPATFDLNDGAGNRIVTVSLEVPLDRFGGQRVQVMPKRPTVLAAVTAPGAQETTFTLAVGQSRQLPGGIRLTLDRVVYFARVDIADDWSVYPIYLLFALAAIAVSASVTLPYRRVVVLAVEDGDGLALHAVLRHSHGAPLFAERVEAALRAAAETAPPEEETA